MGSPAGMLCDDLGLVLLALREEVLHGFVARQLATLHGQVGLRELGHARLDGGEILGA